MSLTDALVIIVVIYACTEIATTAIGAIAAIAGRRRNDADEEGADEDDGEDVYGVYLAFFSKKLLGIDTPSGVSLGGHEMVAAALGIADALRALNSNSPSLAYQREPDNERSVEKRVKALLNGGPPEPEEAPRKA